MIKNYLLTAFRNLLRHKGFSILNIVGLSLSISVCMLIIVIVLDQYSYDNFHTKKDRIYRVISTNTISTDAIRTYATSPIPLGEEISKASTIIEDYVVLNTSFSEDISYKGATLKLEGLFATENFFTLFDFPLTGGDPKKVLADPYSIVLTEESAHKFFGKEEPIGKELLFDSVSYKVTGIIPANSNKSHIQFEGLASMSSAIALAKKANKKDISINWNDYWSSYTYMLIKGGENPESLYQLFDQISLEKYASDDEHKFQFRFQPLNKITPGPILSNELGVSMPKVFIIFLTCLALVIIISAAFNYTSLSVARSLLRAKEVGVRKTLGAQRKQVVFQFLTEAIIITLISSIVGFIILQFLIPGFTSMKLMSLLKIRPDQNFAMYLWFLGFAILTGIISGLLPSIFISAFQPIKVLKGVTNIKLFSKVTLRKILLVTQFAFSMIFIISIILVYRQMNMMMNAEMGFDRDVVYNIRLQGQKFDKIKDIYSSIPEVEMISGSSHVPGVGHIWDMKVRKEIKDENLKIDMFNADENYIKTMGLELIAGSNFPSNVNNNGKYIILNEKAVTKLNFKSPADAIGKSIWEVDDSLMLNICGVVKDYTYTALFMKSEALILRNNSEFFKVATMRINSKNIVQTIDKFKSQWEKIDPIHAYNGQFIDDEIRDYYSYFEDILYTVGFATLLAIIIASLGLLGMATYSAQTRIKEVCIRKVFGAEVKTIIILVSKSYLWLLAIAAIIGAPLAYLINNLWLQNLAYHVNIGFGTMFAGIFIVLLIGLLTISSQTLKASKRNPAQLLRYE